jgi:hypothetical protein
LLNGTSVSTSIAGTAATAASWSITHLNLHHITGIQNGVNN